jgi:hypothetical protein
VIVGFCANNTGLESPHRHNSITQLMDLLRFKFPCGQIVSEVSLLCRMN